MKGRTCEQVFGTAALPVSENKTEAVIDGQTGVVFWRIEHEKKRDQLPAGQSFDAVVTDLLHHPRPGAPIARVCSSARRCGCSGQASSGCTGW